MRCIEICRRIAGCRKLDRESGAFARLTFDAHDPTHHFAELARNRQTETGPSILPGCGHIRLNKGLEELLDLLLGHTDATVSYLEDQPVTTRIRPTSG